MKNSIPCPGCQEEYCCGFMHCDSPAKGHKVAEYQFPEGSRGIIMDAAYINKTPEELREVDKNYQRITLGIMLENLKANGAF